MASPDSTTLYHCVASYRNFHTRRITSLALAPDGDLLASASADGTLVVVNVSNHKPILCIDLEKPLFATCILWPHQRRLYVGRNDGAVQVVAVDVSRATAIIVQALQTVIQLPIRRMAFEGRGRHIWLAIAFMGTVEIYQLESHENPSASTWNLIDEVLTDNSDGELVTSLNFIAPSKDKVALIITHAQRGYSLWKGVNATERQAGTSIGNAHVTRGARIIASTNLSVGGFDLVTITDERLGTSERHYTLEFDEAKNYEIPIRFLSANTVVIGSSRGVVEIVNVESEDRAVLAHGELVAVTTLSEKLNVEIDGGQLVNVLDSFGVNFATGTGDDTGPGTVRFFKPGATAYREYTATGELLDGVRRLSLQSLYSDYLRRRDTTRAPSTSVIPTGHRAEKDESQKMKLGARVTTAFRVLGTYKRTSYTSILICVLAVAIVVLADDPKDIRSPTSARWLPAFLRFHILNALSSFGNLLETGIFGRLGRWWSAAMQQACRSTGASCDSFTT